MTSLALLGALCGGGVFLVVSGLRSKKASLSERVAIYGAPLGARERGAPGDDEDRRPLLESAGAVVDRMAARAGHPLLNPADLALLGRDANSELARLGTFVLASGVGGLLVAGLAGRVVHLSDLVVALAGLFGGLLGALVPRRSLRVEAEKERSRFVSALSCWLQLVALAQAAGMGLESALQASSSISNDRSFVMIRTSLESSRVGSKTPWQALGQLGSELDLPPLAELSATVGLAGLEGARIRSSLAAKADSLRRRQMATAEAAANATTEKLFLPSIVMMLAFMVFLMYPAGARLAQVF